MLAALSAGDEGERPFEVGELSMTDAQLVWSDTSREQPFETTLGPVTFSLSDLHTKSDPDSPFEFEAVTESGESLVWDGTLSLSPFRSRGSWEMRGLRLSKYETYLAEVSPWELTSEVIDASSFYEINWADGTMSYQLSEGRFEVADLKATSGPGSGDEQAFGEFMVQGLEFDSLQRSLRIERVWLGEGGGSLKRGQSGWNWMGINFDDGDKQGLDLETARIDEFELREVDVHISDLAGPKPIDFDTKITWATLERLNLMRLAQ